jgi:phosphoribosylamine--glycine ligase
MRLMVVGSGGREHALAEKLRRDAPGAEIFAAPGNPGVQELSTRVDLRATDVDRVAAFADKEDVDLVVVGPEGPLAAGLVDALGEVGVPAFGPTRAAARLESSKAFAKDLMADVGVPTARYGTFTELDEARSFAGEMEPPVVVKASGLAAGKGALVCRDHDRVARALEEMLEEDRFGAAGETVVVEEFLEGRELSVFFLCDGEDAIPLAASRDHKKLEEGGRGPNTGGMGAYSPVADATAELVEEVRRTVALPVVHALAERGSPYRGSLYAGLMLTPEEPKVLEFNCRLGDPEAQVVLPLVASDLVEPMRAVAAGERFGRWLPRRRDASALVTVLASGGYPRDYETGFPVRIPPDLEGPDLRIYHSGTAFRNGRLVTDGGRVLGITGLGADLPEAARRSREGARRVEFQDATWRSDIGRAELEER